MPIGSGVPTAITSGFACCPSSRFIFGSVAVRRRLTVVSSRMLERIREEAIQVATAAVAIAEHAERIKREDYGG